MTDASSRPGRARRRTDRRINMRRLGMDIMMLLFLGVGAILLVAISMIHDPRERLNTAPPPQGNMMFELYWPDGMDADVDLWVKSGTTGQAVGYSNKSGPLLNLLRDDLGQRADISGRNMEIIYSRGIPDGEFIVNVHLYSLKHAKMPLPVRVVVSAKPGKDKPYKQLFSVSGNLEFEGQEKTMARFEMNERDYVEGSMTSFFEPIRGLGSEGRP